MAGGYPIRVALPGGVDVSPATAAGQATGGVLSGAAGMALNPLGMPISALAHAVAPYANDFAGGLFGINGPLVAPSAPTVAAAAAGKTSARNVTKSDVDAAATKAALAAATAVPPLGARHLSYEELASLSQSLPLMGPRTSKDIAYQAYNTASQALLTSALLAAQKKAAGGDIEGAQKDWVQTQKEELQRRATILQPNGLMGLQLGDPDKVP